jgi:hypothetical protein
MSSNNLPAVRHTHTESVRDYPVVHNEAELDETTIIGSVTGDEWTKFSLSGIEQHVTIKTEDLNDPYSNR